mgnify:CR=1 FL=1
MKKNREDSKEECKVNKKINKPRIVICTILAILILVYIMHAVINLINNPTETFIIRNGQVSKEETEIGYIIRDETIVKGENYKNGMEPIIDEGQKTAKNEAIFRYYSNGEEELKKKIADLDVKIEEKMKENNQELFSTDTKLIDKKINDILQSINKINSVQSMQENKRALNNYITKKAQIAGELSPKGSYLKELVNQRNEYEKELNSNSEYIYAPKSGIMSYRIDGLEDTLTTNDLSKYNKVFLEKLSLKTGQIISTSTEQGKIVNNFECYIACTSKTKEAKNAKIGDKVKLTLPNSREIDAKVNTIINEGNDEVTVIFEFDQCIADLLSYRKISFDIIWWETEGFKVPNSAIINENNLNYVIRTKNGYLTKVLVKLGKQTENYSIVKNYSSSEIKELNISKNAKTTITLYDEILLKPTQEQINSTK